MSAGAATRLPDAAGYEVHLLCCGHLAMAPGTVLPDRGVETPVNALLLRGHDEVVLVDAGSGVVDRWWPGGADLDGALAAAGTTAAAVTCLVLTHLDFDHAGGALAGTWRSPVTPRFDRVVVLDEDLDWWRGRTDPNLGTPLLLEVEPAGVLDPVPAGVEFAPALTLVPLPGHRPGQAGVLVGDELLHAADLLHHALHVEHPEWDHEYDHDVPLALATRREWIARLERTGLPVVFSHVAGRGRIVAGPRFLPDA
jgi:glyoxylase-like metal-dependent hydrolase (beta-lactamase superfamily II)